MTGRTDEFDALKPQEIKKPESFDEYSMKNLFQVAQQHLHELDLLQELEKDQMKVSLHVFRQYVQNLKVKDYKFGKMTGRAMNWATTAYE